MLPVMLPNAPAAAESSSATYQSTVHGVRFVVSIDRSCAWWVGGPFLPSVRPSVQQGAGLSFFTNIELLKYK